MISISLKKLLTKHESRSVIQATIGCLNSHIIIEDTENRLLLGDRSYNAPKKYPIEVAGEVIGWVSGSDTASAIAELISYLAIKEYEKKTLANELLAKYRESTLLYEISHKISATLELKQVTKLVLEEAQRIIQATSGSVLLFNQPNNHLNVVSSFGKEWEKNSLLTFENTIFVNILCSGKGEIVNEVLSDSRFTALSPQSRSFIGVPLKTKDRVIGVIELGNSTPDSYTSEDLRLLTILALQASSAIENAVLHEKQLQESRREALLFRLASQIRHSLNLETILETAVSEIHSLLQVDRCQFIWYKPTEKNSSFIQHPTNIWEVVTESKESELPILIGDYSVKEMGTFTQQLLNMEIVRVDDVGNLSDSVMQEFFTQRNFVSLFALPIQTRSGSIGAIVLGTNQEIRPWCDHEVELLQAVANQLAIALDQAELYREAATAATTAQAQAQQLKQTLYELQQAQTQLVQSEKMSSLGCLVAGVAHEINNPVNFIYGNLTYVNEYTNNLLNLLDLYRQYCVDPVPKIKEQIEEIDLEFMIEDFPKLISSMQVGVDRIREIVASLRNFSRLDQAEMKPVNVHDGIDSTLMILHHRLKGTGERPEIKVIKEYGNLPSVECYAGQLNQVFMNIISNAIDAIEEQSAPGVITINTDVINAHQKSEIPSHILISIRDNGSGILEETRKHLFDPFFTTKQVGKGTGLGLSISYQIVVEKHGGFIKCLSKPGEGAEFLIEIPVKPTVAKKLKRNGDRIINFPINSQTYSYPI
ncbi:MAG TPA: GAF domain-containing protein [Leptolyngbyaceae cyanobacterium]